MAEMARRLDRLRAGVPAASRQSLAEVGARSLRVLKEGYLSGGRLSVRSGRLRGSVGMELGQDAAGAWVDVFAGRGPVKYARIHEEGGTIRPKGGRWLAIPVGPARTRAGVARASSPRDIPGLRFQPSKHGGKAYLVKDQGRRSQIWYVLVRSVTIRAKHYMRDTQALAVAALPDVLAGKVLALAGAR